MVSISNMKKLAKGGVYLPSIYVQQVAWIILCCASCIYWYNFAFNFNFSQRSTRSPRKIFIDLGANCGNTYWRMKNNKTIGSNATLSTPDWEAYLWECNPQLIKWFLNDLIVAEGNDKVHLIPKAASTSDGTISFYLTAGQENATKDQLPNSNCDPESEYNPGGASSIYGSAKRAGEKITVPTVDFLAWHKALQLQANDTVHVKMDIEGAELDIVEAFLADETNQICYWELFWNEYHKEIFVKGSPEYLKHEEFENNFPRRFEEKCGRKLQPNTVG